MASNLFVRVNEYRKVTAPDGTSKIQPTEHGIRLNPAHVVRAYWLGYSTDDHNVFTIYLSDGQRVITDWAGVSNLDGYGPAGLAAEPTAPEAVAAPAELPNPTV